MGASGLNFFEVPGVNDPTLRRDVVILESLKSALELLQSPAFAPAFGGSANQGDYKWGRVHRLVIDHPLGDEFSLTGDRQDNPFRPPFANLPGLPVDGGLETVDAASHSSRANTLQDFEFRQGPLRRFVTSLGGSRRTEFEPSGRGQRRCDQPVLQQPAGAVAHQRDLPLAPGSTRSDRGWRGRDPDATANPCQIEQARQAHRLWRRCRVAAAMILPPASAKPAWPIGKPILSIWEDSPCACGARLDCRLPRPFLAAGR